MQCTYTLPNPDRLAAALEADVPDVKRLRLFAFARGMHLAICDWFVTVPPRFRRVDDVFEHDEVMQMAQEACTQLLLERMTEEATAVTNNIESFTLLFVQYFYSGYLSVTRSAQQNSEDMSDLVWLVGDLAEPDAIAALVQLAEVGQIVIGALPQAGLHGFSP
jgi:hypothetical protein